VECDARIPRSRRPIAVEDDQTCDESSYSVSSMVPPGVLALSDSEKAEALADNLEAQFQPVTDPAVAEAIEMVDVTLRSSVMAPASEPKLTNREEVQDAIRGLKISKAPGPNVIPEQGLEGSPTASGIPPGPVFQRDPTHPSLPYSVEARSYDLYT